MLLCFCYLIHTFGDKQETCSSHMVQPTCKRLVTSPGPHSYRAVAAKAQAQFPSAWEKWHSSDPVLFLCTTCALRRLPLGGPKPCQGGNLREHLIFYHQEVITTC